MRLKFEAALQAYCIRSVSYTHLAFADNTDHTDLACSRNVGTSTEFNRVSELDHTYLITVFFTEQSNSTQLDVYKRQYLECPNSTKSIEMSCNC